MNRPGDTGSPVETVRSRRRHAAHEGYSRGERTVAAGLAVVVVGSVLALGTVHVPVLLVVAAASMALAVRASLLHLSHDRTLPLSWPAVGCFALSAYTLAQAIPLPLGLLAHLAPANAEVWRHALDPAGLPPPRWASVSLDPGASAVEALKGITYGCVFVAAHALAARRRAHVGVAIVLGSAVVAALTTIAHGLLGATRVFGLYEPSFPVAAWHVGPLLNPNNLAGYLGLGALAGFGFLLARRAPLPRVGVALAVATLVAVDVSAASRGGVIALGAGAVLLAVVLRLGAGSRAMRPGERVAWALLAAATAGGGALAMLGGTLGAWTELRDKSVAKLAMLPATVPLIREHAWLGIGRGAFESVFPAYRTAPGHVVYTHVECFPVQWIADWGVPVGALALVGLVAMLAPRKLRVGRNRVATGAWCGVVVLFAQNLVDLGLEVPAIPIAIATILGSLYGGAQRATRGATTRSPERAARALAAACAALALVAFGAAALAGIPDVVADRARLRRALDAGAAQDAAGRAAVRQQIAAAIRRHPAEPYFPLLGGAVALAGHDADPMPWLGRTLERSAIDGRAHLLVAEVLAGRGARTQALLELRFAIRDDAGLLPAASTLALRVTRRCDELLTAAPPGEAGGAALDRFAAELDSAHETAERPVCDAEALARAPSLIGPRWRLGFDALRAFASAEACKEPPARAACREKVERFAADLDLHAPRTSLGARLRAHVLRAEGRAAQAEQMLGALCEHVDDRVACLSARVDAALDARPPARAAADATELLAAACHAPTACAQTATWIGDVLGSRSEWATAVGYYDRAAHEEPSEARWLKVAEAAGRAGAHALAATALEKVGQWRGRVDPQLAERIREERSRAVERLVSP